jgi:hypothetical protein
MLGPFYTVIDNRDILNKLKNNGKPRINKWMLNPRNRH